MDWKVSQERAGLSRIPGPGRKRGLTGAEKLVLPSRGAEGEAGAQIHREEEDFRWRGQWE